ncbi:MAG: protein kinase [Gemmatimonadaceae bacterium]|nr:protein kinase [Gemmatimonadaceae bacterium]
MEQQLQDSAGSVDPTPAPKPARGEMFPISAVCGDEASRGKLAQPVTLPKLKGYDVVAFIGCGGMGDVFRAVQLSTKRAVALKVMRRDFVSEKSRQRFDREVELTARLDHPHIARVYDSGLDEHVYFYAMELIEGQRLDEFIDSQRLGRRQILELMRTIAAAVQHAHQRGVIHRDLKPSNVLISPDGQPHVLDFGLAKTLLEVQQPLISRASEIIGTPAFMSPEQALGQTARIDTRTDIYSLGVMLYKFLTGQWPHDMSGSEQDIMRRIGDGDIKLPREVSGDIDRELEALLLKALARQPEERYASAGDFAGDIHNYLSGDPLTARRPTIGYLLRKRLRKNMGVTVSAAVAIFLAAALAVATFPVASAGAGLLLLTIIVLFGYLRIRHEHNRVLVQRNRMEALLRINEAMNRRQELPALWDSILAEARGLTDADGGSLFMRQGDQLHFVVAQNQTLAQRLGHQAMSNLFKPFALPISEKSIAGYVAQTGRFVNLADSQNISPRLPFRYNQDFDRQHDYQTRSVLAVPVRDPDGAVLGVLQLINRRDASGQFCRFLPDHESLVSSLASLAAVALRYHQFCVGPASNATPGVNQSGDPRSQS